MPETKIDNKILINSRDLKALKRESPVSIMPRPIKKLTLEKELTK